ncbi:cytochrome c oxidase subunit 3 [Pseudogulbenkiania sp. MAI-1]|uniref:cytochrome c oxidase subunit 3 n=1 Tax=Pseudogulbenkiania sp. MAI-1 TaxID=990370 RepID=UPI0004ADA516|nr:cytochrome c oxidase subunit 3 [Pseudogulbenkiania sp. MAI-1]
MSMTVARDDARHAGERDSRPAAAKVALWVFMAVVTVLFAQFLHAYIARMDYADWQRLPTLPTVWLNTALLAASSAALQWARQAGRRGQLGGMKTGLLLGGVLALGFLGGQLWLWRQLTALDYALTSGPASSFFYLLSGLHGLHLIGGLVAWGLTARRVWRDGLSEDAALAVQLCARYWHFLLALWLVLFGLLFLIPPATIQEICRRF